MLIEFSDPHTFQQHILEKKRLGKTIGVVPTMGYLHAGHVALMRQARMENDFVIVTIFVNPKQFAPHEDFDRYPRDIDRDRKLAEVEKVDYIFAPTIESMYPEGYSTYVDVEKVTETLEGVFRPGHFRGVTTVVLKLFLITQPDKAYFGQKDAQQLMAIKKMVRDLQVPVSIIKIPTVREPDGLALSSRNVYLSPDERKNATVLYHALKEAEERMLRGEQEAVNIVSSAKEKLLSTNNISVDYFEVVDPETFQPVSEFVRGKEYCIAGSIRLGKNRLIDNVFVQL